MQMPEPKAEIEPRRLSRILTAVPTMRFFFHLRANGEVFEDTDGVELSNFDSVKNKCSTIMRDALAEEGRLAELAGVELCVVDEQGRTVLIVTPST